MITQATQDAMADVLKICLEPTAKLDIFEKNLCGEYEYVLSGWKVMRDQSRVCWAQK